MSGLKNTTRRLGNFAMGKGYKTSGEAKREKAAAAQGEIDKIYANADMPDDEVIKRNERRKAAKRRGSAVNTILTDQETLG